MIRTARPDEVERLISIEQAAALRFLDHGHPGLAAAAPAAPDVYRALLYGRRTLVATDGLDQPVGFAITEKLDRTEWLCELSVHPDHGRRGIGGALLAAVVGSALARGCDNVGLSTFREVPFNAPFYARHGFVEAPLDRVAPPLARRFMDEVPAGIDPLERVLMVRMLRPRTSPTAVHDAACPIASQQKRATVR